ncbi:hypothetical protein B8V81_4139 [Paenibacillus pasadenensis]|uniref:Uncharacterized protein n=1 Tax=Paenibacillus pasadenensis TaxID=217090 RepID=A0A2N5N5T6_9BACL|nr:hypothetical protein B8V81_4139 [Paenibacillus pasadenensis]
MLAQGGQQPAASRQAELPLSGCPSAADCRSKKLALSLAAVRTGRKGTLFSLDAREGETREAAWQAAFREKKATPKKWRRGF